MWLIVRRQLRRPLMPLLVIFQVALACAITCNALFLLNQQLMPILASDGISDPGRLVFLHNIAARGDPWPAVRMRGLKADLSAVPGVRQVSYAATLPMISSAQWAQDVRTAESNVKVSATVYFGDNLINSLGLQLTGGRDFTPEEEATTLDINIMGSHKYEAVIITEALAARLFPNGRAVGNLLPDSNSQIVGVVAHLIRNNPTKDSRALEYAILVPGIVQQWAVPMFAVRLASSDTDQTCKNMLLVLKQDVGSELLPGDQIGCDSYATLRNQELAAPLAAVWLLSGVTLVVLIVTITGILGMTGYWVQQRTRSIGVCRALGARRSDVIREVLIENAVVVGMGAIVGLVAAYGINLWLMRHYELSHLPLSYFPVGALLLLVLGQLAALAPAHRASNIQPIVATRAI
ncbi:FtsX-like permease family protein [Rhodanobacter sp. B04]|uniref:ABC transporter permease n=1 Tax=Rhodanobacter sp. B04 TaxID=1945860 RepID=UPI0009874951|nr:FtsX-like permease family protein [Rhodanobacter sp. B04]